ncbi:MAG: hypothetical protein AAF138_00895 [Planctomycetota bacterium]
MTPATMTPSRTTESAGDASATPTAIRDVVRPGPLMGDDPVQHLKYVIGNTAKRTWPYPHFVCPNVFPAAFYREMLARFPADEHMPPLNTIFPKRLSLRIGVPDELDALPSENRQFWRELGLGLGSRSFMRFVLRQYDPLLDARFGELVEPHIYLHSDVHEYGIGPHVDMRRKIVSMIFYMPDEPRDDLNAASVLVKNEPGIDAPPPQDEAWEGFTSASTVPFEPNILFTFAVTNESWHGVRPNPEGVPRRSLQYFLIMPNETEPGAC